MECGQLTIQALHSNISFADQPPTLLLKLNLTNASLICVGNYTFEAGKRPPAKGTLYALMSEEDLVFLLQGGMRPAERGSYQTFYAEATSCHSQFHRAMAGSSNTMRPSTVLEEAQVDCAMMRGFALLSLSDI